MIIADGETIGDVDIGGEAGDQAAIRLEELLPALIDESDGSAMGVTTVEFGDRPGEPPITDIDDPRLAELLAVLEAIGVRVKSVSVISPDCPSPLSADEQF